MKPAVYIITKSDTDFTTLTSVAMQTLGKPVTAASDAVKRKLSSAEKFLSCLASIQGLVETGLPTELLTHVHFSALLLSDSADTLAILECASGMPFVSVPTTKRNVDLTVISGSLQQWRDAVVAGSQRDGYIRDLYLAIMDQFRGDNLDVWGKYERQPSGLLSWKK